MRAALLSECLVCHAGKAGNAMSQEKNTAGTTNTKYRDSSSKIIFEDPTLCAQFLKGYLDIPLLQDVQPEDIEDVTSRYVHLFTEERNSNVVMQVFRYMVFIWEDYEKEIRVLFSDVLGEYIPNYRCALVQLREYSNADLMKREDVLSVVMMMMNLHRSSDFARIESEVSREYLQKVLQSEQYGLDEQTAFEKATLYW